jgi:hypothetical protein
MGGRQRKGEERRVGGREEGGRERGRAKERASERERTSERASERERERERKREPLGRHYLQAEDHMSVVRVHCSKGRFAEAEAAAAESGSAAAAHYLGTQVPNVVS